MGIAQVLYYILVPLFIFLCLIMILLVLVQKGRGGGLSSAFGGGGGNTAFGAKTGDVLTWATSVVFALFVILAVALNLVSDKVGVRTQTAAPIQQLPVQTPANPSSSTPGK
jgi:preprotein translocase subunit SecG